MLNQNLIPRSLQQTILTGERLIAAEAMELLMRLDAHILEARAQWNHDWFRRLMRIRPKAVSRLRRRWTNLDTPPAIPLGRLKRRYHANLARYLYRVRELPLVADGDTERESQVSNGVSANNTSDPSC